MENMTAPQAEAPDEKSPWRRGRIFAALIIAALFLIGVIQVLTGSRGFVTTEINDRYLGVDGTFGSPVFWELASISEVRLVDSFAPGVCVEGEETKNTMSGTYCSEELGTYTVHAYLKGPHIVARSPDGVLVFNCASASATQKLYDRLARAAGGTDPA